MYKVTVGNDRLEIMSGTPSPIELSMPPLTLRTDGLEGTVGWINFFRTSLENSRMHDVDITIGAMGRQNPSKGEVAYLSLRSLQTNAGTFVVPEIFGKSRLFYALSIHTDQGGRMTSITGEFPLERYQGTGFVTAQRRLGQRGYGKRWDIVDNFDYRKRPLQRIASN